jgi:hypothetical protein
MRGESIQKLYAIHARRGNDNLQGGTAVEIAWASFSMTINGFMPHVLQRLQSAVVALARCAQGNVHTAVLSQNNDVQVVENFRPLRVAQVGILFDQLFHLVGSEFFLLAKAARFNGSVGNTLFNQELLGASDTASEA